MNHARDLRQAVEAQLRWRANMRPDLLQAMGPAALVGFDDKVFGALTQAANAYDIGLKIQAAEGHMTLELTHAEVGAMHRLLVNLDAVIGSIQERHAAICGLPRCTHEITSEREILAGIREQLLDVLAERIARGAASVQTTNGQPPRPADAAASTEDES